jgi:osmoprotectant transport system ATP-binding protein
VSKSFQRGAPPALDGVTLKVRSGECLALVGESGSGKTTLLRCFNGTVEPDRGRVRVRGTELGGVPATALRRSMGFVQQEGGLLPHWTCLRNVELVPRLLDLPDAEERARAALARMGLDPVQFGGRWPGSLSGGQRQRVALARALAADPDILLLDEPFSALDAISRAELHRSFLQLKAQQPLTTLLITHDLREAALLGDRIVVIRGGSILQEGTLEELRGAPADPYVALLLAEAGVA